MGRTVRHLSAKQGFSQEANGFNSRTLRHAEGTAEWPATGPENRGIVMSDGRSIRLPSAKLSRLAGAKLSDGGAAGEIAEHEDDMRFSAQLT